MTHNRPAFDPAYMDIALDLARKSRPSPNPRVGAVVVAKGEIVGRGYHENPGMPHAEVLALKQAGEHARGGDLYVTLEPCCHQGLTGPCVSAIQSAGISRVAVGMIDPDPRVKGKGIKQFEQLEIEFVLGLRENECQQLLAGYTIHRTKGRPMVTLKAAITLDGSLATTTGDSKWISSQASRTLAHGMRAEADAILVGIETVIKDNPDLTVRLCPGENPLRVVMDSRLRIPLDSNLIATAEQSPVLLAYTKAEKEAVNRFDKIEGVETLNCKATNAGLVDPLDLAKKLGSRGILSLFVEGGGKIHGAFAGSGLADRVALFVSPKILGSGLGWVSFPGITAQADAIQLLDLTVTPVDSDLLIEGRFVQKEDD